MKWKGAHLPLCNSQAFLVRLLDNPCGHFTAANDGATSHGRLQEQSRVEFRNRAR
jgi:hypothetical protein